LLSLRGARDSTSPRLRGDKSDLVHGNRKAMHLYLDMVKASLPFTT
jgi:hypothetical protein